MRESNLPSKPAAGGANYCDKESVIYVHITLSRKFPGKDKYIVHKMFRNYKLTPTNKPTMKTFLNACSGIDFSFRREFTFMYSTE